MLPHMDRPADRKAGCKHRCTDAAMNYLKAEVMEMCHSEGLYQIDLLNGSKERITEREYWAQKKGQAALDRANAPIAADGIAPRQTKLKRIRRSCAGLSGKPLPLLPALMSLPPCFSGRCDRQGEPGAAKLPHAGQDEANYRPEAGGRF